MYVFLRSMSSHEDSTTGRNQEEKETEVVEEVEVEAEPVLGGVTEAVGRGGDDPAAGGGGGSVRVGGSGSSTFSDAEVRAMPGRSLLRSPLCGGVPIIPMSIGFSMPRRSNLALGKTAYGSRYCT